MKILWITAECPYPANTGGRIGIWKRITELSKNNDIYLYSIIDDENEKNMKNEMLRYCKEVHFFPRRNKTLLFLFSCLFYPFPAVSRWNKNLKRDITTRCNEEKIDYVIVDFPQMVGVLSQSVRKSQRIILNQHNNEYVTLRSQARSLKSPIKKAIFYFTAFQMKYYEKSIYNKDFVKLYTFVSSEDMDYFTKAYKKTNTYLLPVGAEVDDQITQNDEKNIMFVGKMSYPPNVEGVKWFLDNCWDKIREKINGANLFIVGKEPSVEVVNSCAGRKGVHLTGTVPSVDEYYHKASLVIIPLLNGGGVKVKLLEALGHGKIVISTSKGVEGTDFKHNIHLFVEDEPEKFAQYCIDILDNPEKYDMIRKTAYQKIKDQYTWDKIIEKFEKLLMSDPIN